MFIKKLKKNLGIFFLTGFLLCARNIAFAHLLNVLVLEDNKKTSNMSLSSQAKAPAVTYTIEINGRKCRFLSTDKNFTTNIKEENRNIYIGEITATLDDSEHRKALTITGYSRELHLKNYTKNIGNLILSYIDHTMGGKQITIHDSKKISLDYIKAPRKEILEIAIIIKAPSSNNFYTAPFNIAVEVSGTSYEKITSTKVTFSQHDIKNKQQGDKNNNTEKPFWKSFLTSFS